MIVQVDPINLHRFRPLRTAHEDRALEHLRDGRDIGKLEHGVGHQLRVLDALDVFSARLGRDFEIRGIVRHRAHPLDRGLQFVLDENRALRAQDGVDEKLLEAAGGRLRHDKKPHPQDDAGQAHHHGPLFGGQKSERDGEIRRHSSDGISRQPCRGLGFGGSLEDHLHAVPIAKLIELIDDHEIAGFQARDDFDFVEVGEAGFDLAKLHSIFIHDKNP